MLLKNNFFFILVLLSIVSSFNISAVKISIVNDNDSNLSLMQLGIASIQNKRFPVKDNEDRYIHKKLPDGRIIFAVFDGHGGSACAEYAKEHYYDVFKEIEAKTSGEKLRNSVLKIDKDWLGLPDVDDSGSTAIIAVVDGKKLYLSNTGDSRGILIHNGKVIFSTKDHKPDETAEKKRIKKAGGKVTFNGCWRVNGTLAVSRAIGDKDLKKWVIPDPDVTEHSLEKNDLIVLASDGLWDVITNEDAAKFVQDKLREKQKDLDTIADHLARQAEGKESRDDITVVIYQHLQNSSSTGKEITVYHRPSDQINPNKKATPRWKKLTFIGTTTTLFVLLFLYHYNFFSR